MAQVWKIAPGEHAEDWDLFRQTGCIGLGWFVDGNYRDFKDEREVLSALEQEYGKNKKGYGRGAARMVWQFTNKIEQSDIVIANEAYNRVVGVGRIESPYLPPSSPKNPIRNDKTTHRHHVRLVDWVIVRPV